MIPCLSRALFGIDCPGCGAQRALVMVLQGRFGQAFHMFPAIYTSILLAALLTLHLIDRSRNYQKAVIAAATINGVIMIVAYIYKITHI